MAEQRGQTPPAPKPTPGEPAHESPRTAQPASTAAALGNAPDPKREEYAASAARAAAEEQAIAEAVQPPANLISPAPHGTVSDPSSLRTQAERDADAGKPQADAQRERDAARTRQEAP